MSICEAHHNIIFRPLIIYFIKHDLNGLVFSICFQLTVLNNGRAVRIDGVGGEVYLIDSRERYHKHPRSFTFDPNHFIFLSLSIHNN
jgi:hypothetical protein